MGYQKHFGIGVTNNECGTEKVTNRVKEMKYSGTKYSGNEIFWDTKIRIHLATVEKIATYGAALLIIKKGHLQKLWK